MWRSWGESLRRTSSSTLSQSDDASGTVRPRSGDHYSVDRNAPTRVTAAREPGCCRSEGARIEGTVDEGEVRSPKVRLAPPGDLCPARQSSASTGVKAVERRGPNHEHVQAQIGRMIAGEEAVAMGRGRRRASLAASVRQSPRLQFPEARLKGEQAHVRAAPARTTTPAAALVQATRAWTGWR